MNQLFIHHRIFRLVSAPLMGVMVYLLILLINNTVENVDQLFSNQELYVCIALSYISFESMRGVVSALDRHLPSTTSFQNRLVWQISTTSILSMAAVGLAISAYYEWVIGFSIGRSELNTFLLIFSAISLLYNILYFSHYLLFAENKRKVEEERALRETLESEFASFKNEINPHLLYESLESLILALQQNVDQADELIDYLAGIYRYNLVNRHKELVSLKEELGATNYLLGLLNYRLNGLVRMTWDDLDTSSLLVIPGSLVVSIDSVVRNTLIGQEKPLIIRIYREDEYVVVQHTLNDRLQPHAESMEAFARIQRSYSFFSELPFVQVKADRENYIKFPVVNATIDQTVDLTA